MKSVRLLLAALALTAMATWSFPAPPAGTTVLNTGTVTDGTLTIATTPALTVQLDGAAPAPCTATAPTIGIDLTADTADWDVDLTAFATAPRLSFTYAGSTWFLGFTMFGGGSGVGTIGAPSGYAWTQSSSVSAQIYPETAPGSCVANTGAPKCTTLILGTSFSGSLSAGAGIGGETIVAGTTFAVSGGTVAIVATGCTAPFTSLFVGRTVTLAGVEITF